MKWPQLFAKLFGELERPDARNDLPFILEDDGFYGRIRQGGEVGRRLPDLLAHRPESWRFTRLSKLLDLAREIISDDLDEVQARLSLDAIEQICDAKGDFTVTWRSSDALSKYRSHIDRALREFGEDEILHEVSPPLT